MEQRRKRTSDEMNEPVIIQRNIPEIFQIFQNVQHNTVQHKKYVKELKKVYLKIDDEAFRESFKNALQYTFLFGDANGNVDRVLQFVASFCSYVDDNEPFLRFVFEIAFDCVSASGAGVRSRSCQFIGMLLTAMGDDASLDEDICDKILSTQLERLRDIKGAVRCRAVVTLQRLQCPTDDNDPVTVAYIFHMSCDPCAAVRRAVILSLAKGARNLLHVLERLCDVDESVRKAAFLYVTSINVTRLKVRQRMHILKVGFSERSPRVRKVVETALIPSWLGTYCGDVLALFNSIRLDDSQGMQDFEVVAENLLKCLFKNRDLKELVEWLPIDSSTKLIPIEKLNKDNVWFWQHFVYELHSTENVEYLEQALPELILFTNYIKSIFEMPFPSITEEKEYNVHQTMLQQLINIFMVYDMADEVGRKALQTLINDILVDPSKKIDSEVIRSLMRVTDIVIPDVTNRIQFVSTIISEIHEPIEEIVVPSNMPIESDETKLLRTKLRVSLNEALEAQEEAVSAQDFSLAATCKEKVDSLQKKLEDLNLHLKESEPVMPTKIIKEKLNDADTLNKCLILLNTLLDNSKIKKITPILQSLFQMFEVMIFQNIEIRENALQTIALFSMLSEDFAREHKAFLFSELLNMDNEKLVVTALKCVMDIMCVQGVDVFNINVNQNLQTSSDINSTISKKNKSTKEVSEMIEENEEIISSQDTIIDLFLRLISSDFAQYREVVVEGLCRLLMIGRMSSSSLITHLLILWFNPATEEEDTLRQLLGTFFPAFAAHVEGAQEQLEAAFIPTLLTLANAPVSSPLLEVDKDIVIKFMIGLTMPTVTPAAYNVHTNLCVSLVNALEKDDEITEPIFCRALSLLTPPKTLNLCEDLLHSVSKMLDIITNKSSLRDLAKFEALLHMTIEELEKLPSENHERFTQEPTISSLISDRNSNMPRASSLISNPKHSEGVIDNLATNESNNSTLRDHSVDHSSPAKKIRAISASDVALRAVRRSTRTPLKTTRTPVANSRKRNNTLLKKNTTETPKTNSCTNKPVKQSKKVPAKSKNVAKKKKLKESKKIEINEKSFTSSSASSSSDEETVLHTICHEKSLVRSALYSSSDEEVTKKQKHRNITIQPSDSDSSDGLLSDEDNSTLHSIKQVSFTVHRN